METNPFMLDGEVTRITFNIDKNRICEFEEWFGSSYSKFSDNGATLQLNIKANDSSFIRWAIQSVDFAEVVAPHKVVDKISSEIRKLTDRYQNRIKEVV